jgi:fructosamine-3-kinase
MIRAVFELDFDEPPGRAVVKVASGEPDPFRREAFELAYLRAHSRLPVPEVYSCKPAGEVIAPAFLLMERLPGVNLGEARMTPGERRDFDAQLAEILLELHSHEGDAFGALDGSETCARWLDWFQPRIRENFDDAKPRLTTRSLELIPSLLDALPRHFASQGRPTLVHGDLWATNILAERLMHRWLVTGFVDPASRYADVEYELAYLECFGTVTGAFFERYRRERPACEGYEVRKLYYWLDTLMLHVWLFGDSPCVARTEEIAVELSRRV